MQSKIEFPVKPEIFIAQFQGAEGITFNAEGRLFIGANNSIWSTGVPYPNGLALSLDHRTLYVAQVFSALKPIVFDDRIWAFRINQGVQVGPPKVVARTGGKGVDGLVTDELGRVYVADNGAGKIHRFDPKSGETILIAEGMPGVAQPGFREGKFDREAIYATSTQRGGGKIWKIRVGTRGAKYHR